MLGSADLAPLVAPGTGFDGVVLITTTIGGTSFTGTGFLLPSGRHVLTAAHNFTNDQNQIALDRAATVSFDMPNVGRINIDVPATSIVLNPGYAGNPENDLAVMTLPVLAPSGPAGTLGAERYPIYRGTDEVGQAITIVGYGTIGTGTTGQQNNTDLTKRMAQNRYDTTGDRVNYGGTGSLLYDFDNGTAANDAFGRLLGINDLGVTGEGTSGQGDSGGPVFITVNGQRFVAGTTTTGPDEKNPANPAVVNPAVKAGFGSISQDSRLSFYAGFIDANSAQPAAEALDLRVQVVGQDAVRDTIAVRVVGGNLQLVVNGNVYQSIPLAGVTSLTLTGAGADGTPFDTDATIENSVPAALAVTQQRIRTFTDLRTAPPATPTTAAAPVAAAPPANAQPGPKPELPLDLNSFPNDISPAKLVAVGAGPGGGPVVTVSEAVTGKVVRTITAFDPSFRGGVRVALGDVTGDFVDDVIVAAGPGGGSHVKVFDGTTGNEIRSFFAFAGRFDGGLYVASGDINNDGRDDIVVSAGAGGGPVVKVFDGATGAEIRSFFAYGEGLRGGTTVAVGDINDDGVADIITGAGAGGAAHVKAFDGVSGAEIKSFFAYDAALRDGVFVAAGDVQGGGAMDIITGAGGASPHVKVFDAETLQTRLSFFATPATSGGARVAAADADGDGLTDVVAATGDGIAPVVRVFEGEAGKQLAEFFPLDPGFRGGVFVGGRG